MKTKKGISPLIATVLIIGFTIVIAAMVMQWGTGLFENIKTQTGISSEISIACSSELSNLKITGAKLVGTNIEVTIDNSNEKDISGFLFRIHQGTDVKTVDSSTLTYVSPATQALAGFGVQTYSVSIPTGITIITGTDKIGAMAKITASDASTHTCTNEINLVTITA